MADKDYEPDDPFQPVAVALATPGYDGLEAMARCLVEEYAMLGWPPERIYRLFTIPEFAGSYAVMQERGEAYVRSIIAGVFGEAVEAPPAKEPSWLIPVLRRGTPEGGPDATGI